MAYTGKTAQDFLNSIHYITRLHPDIGEKSVYVRLDEYLGGSPTDPLNRLAREFMFYGTEYNDLIEEGKFDEAILLLTPEKLYEVTKYAVSNSNRKKGLWGGSNPNYTENRNRIGAHFNTTTGFDASKINDYSPAQLIFYDAASIAQAAPFSSEESRVEYKTALDSRTDRWEGYNSSDVKTIFNRGAENYPKINKEDYDFDGDGELTQADIDDLVAWEDNYKQVS